MSQSPRYVSKLQKHLVLVLGGTSGVGFCVAEAAVEHGAEVVVSSSSAEKVSRAIDLLRCVARPLTETSSEGNQEKQLVRGTTCNLSDPASLEVNLEKVLEFATSGRIHLLDHVVFTAGDGIQLTGLEEMTVDTLVTASLVRVIAPTILAKLLPKYVRRNVTSSYTLTNGTNSYQPPPGWGVLSGQTAHLEGLARGLAVDLKPIRVNTVMLGLVPTELHDPFPEDVKKKLFESYKKSSVLNTLGTPQEVAEAYIYCMKNSFTTGTVMTTDGGRLLV